MSSTIQVNPASRIYFGDASSLLSELLPKKRVIVISDVNVDRIHGKTLFPKYEKLLIGIGEHAKGLMSVQKLYEGLIEMEADRNTFILGVGGGIVTDVAGFVASTYMRGVEFGFVSTTLLGQVDASIGGKNGININGYKNMVGCFSQPKFIISDAKLLLTLDEKNIKAGLGEVIKTGIIGDPEIFSILERTTFMEVRLNADILASLVLRSAKVKADIVRQDEKEGGLRRVLNLGHTLAHSIEKNISKYSHGEAVAIGIYYVAQISLNRGIISREAYERIMNILDRYYFDLSLDIIPQVLVDAVGKDKKRAGDKLHLILPTGIGGVRDELLSLDEIKELFLNVLKK